MATRSRKITRELDHLVSSLRDNLAGAINEFQRHINAGRPEDAMRSIVDAGGLADIFKRLIGSQLVFPAPSDVAMIEYAEQQTAGRTFGGEV